ncbi:hypothetical protein BSKO_10743 [Bryopsis sp. KO-2023]|nr:hypothetical protein BSKO_10743 [Bryopsis sp. KO-2023]
MDTCCISSAPLRRSVDVGETSLVRLSKAAWFSGSAPCRSWAKRRIHRKLKAVDGGGEEADFNEELKRDLLKFGGMEPSATPAADTSQGQKEESAGLKETVDKVLMADFFFVLFALGWLTSGVLFNSLAHRSFVLDAWMMLWPVVFQPAIGVLMLGALVSGAVGWAKENSK